MKRCINMYENNYKNEKLTGTTELDLLLNLLADLGEPLELFAMGGTAMVLNGIKEATKDIDFLTLEAPEKIRELFNLAGLKEESSGRICNVWRLDDIRVDIFYDGYIIGTQFPDDWQSLSRKIKELGKVKISILNWYDLIISKLARSEKRDIEDIILILKSQKLDFNFLKKRYYSVAEESLIAEFDYKFKHMEREYAKCKAD